MIEPFGENIFNVIYANDNLIKEASELFRDYRLELIYDSRDESFIILKNKKKAFLALLFLMT